MGIPAEKLTVIKNGISHKLFNPNVDGSGVRQKLKLEKIKSIYFLEEWG